MVKGLFCSKNQLTVPSFSIDFSSVLWKRDTHLPNAHIGNCHGNRDRSGARQCHAHSKTQATNLTRAAAIRAQTVCQTAWDSAHSHANRLSATEKRGESRAIPAPAALPCKSFRPFDGAGPPKSETRTEGHSMLLLVTQSLSCIVC
jgi:hypothetical protein